MYPSALLSQGSDLPVPVISHPFRSGSLGSKIWDEILPSYIGIIINHYSDILFIRIPMNQPVLGGARFQIFVNFHPDSWGDDPT